MTPNLTILPDNLLIASMVQNLFSVPFRPNDNVESTGYAVQAKWVGTPTGTLKLQISMDSTDSSIWVDLADSSVNTGGVTGTQLWNVTHARYNYVRVVYGFVSGTGTLEINRSK